jgi:hypothetical protein
VPGHQRLELVLRLEIGSEIGIAEPIKLEPEVLLIEECDPFGLPEPGRGSASVWRFHGHSNMWRCLNTVRLTSYGETGIRAFRSISTQLVSSLRISNDSAIEHFTTFRRLSVLRLTTIWDSCNVHILSDHEW